ncbi:hypothetical protein B0H13DRAFT_1862959 [Mycena leptocephala]|nr:hypothetical protein B0H13DRAFT_1862959 [Mycena leptocephala]
MYTITAFGDPTSLMKFPVSLDVTIVLHGTTVIIDMTASSMVHYQSEIGMVQSNSSSPIGERRRHGIRMDAVVQWYQIAGCPLKPSPVSSRDFEARCMRYGARVIVWVEAELPDARVKPGAGVVPDACAVAVTVIKIPE